VTPNLVSYCQVEVPDGERRRKKLWAGSLQTLPSLHHY
jgi:hypothetical protein